MKWIVRVASVMLMAASVRGQTASGAGSDPSVADNSTAALSQANPDVRVAFKVKYVVEGVAYLEGGRDSGLAEGVRLFVRDTDPVDGRPVSSADGEQKAIALLQVFAVAETSSAAEVHDPARAVKSGDWAFLSAEDTTALVLSLIHI